MSSADDFREAFGVDIDLEKLWRERADYLEHCCLKLSFEIEDTEERVEASRAQYEELQAEYSRLRTRRANLRESIASARAEELRAREGDGA